VFATEPVARECSNVAGDHHGFMYRGIRWFTVFVACLVLCARATSAEWRVDAEGGCSFRWRPSDALHGPLVVLDSPLAAARVALGTYIQGWRDCFGRECTALDRAAWMVVGLPFSAYGAVWTGSYDLLTGLSTALTFGSADVTIPDPQRLVPWPAGSLWIDASGFVRRGSDSPCRDRCGRDLCPDKSDRVPANSVTSD
jgi:hypothetical protein